MSHFQGVKTYSDPSYTFSGGQEDPSNLCIHISISILNGDITLEARRHWQDAAKVISPFIIFAVFDVSMSFRRYKL